MSNKQFLADQVKGGLVKIGYTCAVNNKDYMPMPLATPDKRHDSVTVRFELQQSKRSVRKPKKSILL